MRLLPNYPTQIVCIHHIVYKHSIKSQCVHVLLHMSVLDTPVFQIYAAGIQCTVVSIE